MNNVITKSRITIRRAHERGHAARGWLDSRHTFSFAEYFDAAHMGFRSLRVINEDRVAAGGGFPTHPHKDMEIFSYVVSGELEHRDSMGNSRINLAGELQGMSAGNGIAHSEGNASRDKPVHFLQIWILPNQKNLTPTYSEWKPTAGTPKNLTLLASPNGEDNSVVVHQDARIYLGQLEAGDSVEYSTTASRGLWLQVIDGEIEIDGETLSAGDGASVENIERLTVRATDESQFLLFDLA